MMLEKAQEMFWWEGSNIRTLDVRLTLDNIAGKAAFQETFWMLCLLYPLPCEFWIAMITIQNHGLHRQVFGGFAV